MKKNTLVSILTIIGTLALTTLAGCGGIKHVTAKSDQIVGSATLTEGGTLTLAMFCAPSGKYLPQVWDNEYDQRVSGFSYDSLLEYNRDLTYKPLLAEKWDVSTDKKTITWHLQANATWSDGQPVTADDLAWTWNWMASKAYNEIIQGPYQGNVSYIQGFDEVSKGQAKEMSGIHVLDPHTVSVTLKSPYSAAIAILGATQTLPKHIWESVPPSQYKLKMQDPKMLIGDGPYTVSVIHPEESYTLVKNPNYYGGKPHIDTIIWKVVNADVAAGLLKIGAIDMVPGLSSPTELELYRQLPNTTKFEFASTYFQYLGFKLNNPTLQDKNIRHAIAYAIDREGIIKGLLQGHGDILHVPLYVSSWANPPANQIQPYEYNIDQAKKILDAAGYRVGKDGYRVDVQGKPFELTLAYPLGNKVRERIGPVIASELQAIGLHVNLAAPKDFAAFMDDVQNDKGIDLWLMGWGGQLDPDQTGFWDKKSQYNFAHLDSLEEEQMVADAVSGNAFDLDYRKHAMWKWCTFMNDHLPWLPLYGERDIYIWNNRLQGIEKLPTIGIYQDVQNWWIIK